MDTDLETDGVVLDFDRMRTLGDVARYHGRERPQAEALQFEGRVTTFEQFDRHTSQIANGLIAAGLKRADRIAYVGKNSDHYFELFFGAAKAGVVITPVGWRLAGAEIAYALADAEARALFVGPEVEEVVREIAPQLPARPSIFAMEAGGGDWPTFESWRDAQSPEDPAVAVDEQDVAIQLYTSGTTGRPKGAMLTHANLLRGRQAAVLAGLAWNVWKADDVSLIAMPVSHIGGAGWGAATLVHGAKGVVSREFDPFKVLDFIEQDRVSKIFLVPAALQIVVRQPRAREVDYSRLKYILYGAAPIPLDLLREAIDIFGCGFVQQYGMTETTGTIVYLPPEDHDPAGNLRMRSVGLPMPGVEIKVVDETGAEVPRGTVGEIATRSIYNMIGYWNLEAATAATLDADGWLRTGDAGYMDEDGYLFIHDRIKDLIITGGENVYPAEVESAIYGHPAVAEVAVIGVPDAKWGEAVKAIVVLKPGAPADPAAIIAFARGRIAAFKAPKSIDFIPALPRNASGKVLRRELREPYWAGLERRVN